MIEPIDIAAEITTDWLGRALGGDVSAVDVRRIGSGQIGSCFRCEITGFGVPPRVVVKLPTTDAGTRAMLTGAYRSEVNFYRELASTVAVAVPRCHAATDVEPDGRFALVLEDLAPAAPGDQIEGWDAARIRSAAVNLAGLHGPRWCDPTLLDTGWLLPHTDADARVLAEVYASAVRTFLADLGNLLSATAIDVLEQTVGVVADWSLAEPDRFALLHGDYRLDNLTAHPGTGEVRAVDWQTLSLGLPARDLAYLISTGMTPENRRRHERDLVAAYHRGLRAHGVTDHDLDTCWHDYRLAMVQAALVPVLGCAYGTRTDRGDRMFATMVERGCTAMQDHRTLDLIA